MNSISLYEEKNSFLNKRMPQTKFLYIFVALFLPVLSGNGYTAVFFIIISCILLMTSNVMRKTLPLLGFSGIILITVFVIQGMFYHKNTNIFFQIGFLHFYKEGVYFALGIIRNVLNILLSFCVFVLTTKPSDMIESLIKKGFSPRFGYVILSVFLIIPQMTETMQTITDAQRSRGMETKGNLWIRIKAFFPLIMPVVMSSLMNTKERALALEVRGFNANTKRTFIYETKRPRLETIYQMILLISLLCGLIWRIILWMR